MYVHFRLFLCIEMNLDDFEQLCPQLVYIVCTPDHYFPLRPIIYCNISIYKHFSDWIIIHTKRHKCACMHHSIWWHVVHLTKLLILGVLQIISSRQWNGFKVKLGALYTRSHDQGNSRIEQSYWWRAKNWS
jgi:hypothetical protein